MANEIYPKQSSTGLASSVEDDISSRENLCSLASLFVHFIISSASQSQQPTSKTTSDSTTMALLHASEALAFLSLSPPIKQLLVDDSPSSFLPSLHLVATRALNLSTGNSIVVDLNHSSPSTNQQDLRILKPNVYSNQDVSATSSTSSPTARSLVYLILTLIANLTAYKPRLTPQEKQIKKLREMARADEPGSESRQRQDAAVLANSAVEQRCRKCVDAGSVKLVVAAITSGAASSSSSTRSATNQAMLLSPQVRAVVAQILQNVVTEQDPRRRGLVIQQGGVRALMIILMREEEEEEEEEMKKAVLDGDAVKESNLRLGPLTPTATVAAQTLAKLAITADPTIAFSSSSVSSSTSASSSISTSTSAADLVRPLTRLLHPQRHPTTASLIDSPASASAVSISPSSIAVLPLLHFEGLMALTNLASIAPPHRMGEAVRASLQRCRVDHAAEALVLEYASEQGVHVTKKEGKGDDGGVGEKHEEGVEDDDGMEGRIMVRRAATELLANLAMAGVGLDGYVVHIRAAKASELRPVAATRLRLLIAMADVADFATRRAAGGALAVLSSVHPDMASAMLMTPDDASAAAPNSSNNNNNSNNNNQVDDVADALSGMSLSSAVSIKSSLTSSSSPSAAPSSSLRDRLLEVLVAMLESHSDPNLLLDEAMPKQPLMGAVASSAARAEASIELVHRAVECTRGLSSTSTLHARAMKSDKLIKAVLGVVQRCRRGGGGIMDEIGAAAAMTVEALVRA